MDKVRMSKLREFLKDDIRREIDFSTTDQNTGVPVPPFEKECSEDDIKIDLIKPENWKGINSISVEEAIEKRHSKRKYSSTSLTLDELSYLLWATQGIRKVFEGRAFRTVPSAGCRHPLETYIAAINVEGLERAIYRYLPITHQLVFVSKPDNLTELVNTAANDQPFVGNCAATFIWTAIPYRTEWRYSYASHKVIALDAGHVCQNLYLACESIDAGTCAIASYNQKLADKLVNVDGEEEFVIYMAPVGKNL